jgi:DNA polymerase-3 subunit delta'
MLLCSEAGDDLTPCGLCPSCRKIAAGNHPDVVEVALLARRATIGVEQAREVQQAARFAPLEGPWKIFLLPEAHRFTEQAMNGLLKTLEEPVERRIFVLMTPSHGALLPTILSRCQLVRFAPLQADEVSRWLVGLGVSEAQAGLAATLSEGRPGMALRMASDTRLWEFRDRVLAVAETLASADGCGLMDAAEKLEPSTSTEKRLAVERTLEMLTMWFRDIVWLQRGLDERRVLNRDRLEALREAAGRYRFETAMGALRALAEAREQVRGNVAVKLMFTRLALHLRS